MMIIWSRDSFTAIDECLERVIRSDPPSSSGRSDLISQPRKIGQKKLSVWPRSQVLSARTWRRCGFSHPPVAESAWPGPTGDRAARGLPERRPPLSRARASRAGTPAAVAAPRRKALPARAGVAGWRGWVRGSGRGGAGGGGGAGAGGDGGGAEEPAAGPGPRASIRAPWMRIGCGGGGGGGVGGRAPGRWERGGWGRCRVFPAWRRPPRCCCYCCPGPGRTSTSTRWEVSRADAAAPGPLPHPPARRSGRPGAAWKARRPGWAPRPSEGAFRLGLAEQESRELGGGISVRSRTGGLHVQSAWASFPRPELNSRPTPGLGAPGAGAGSWWGSGLTSPQGWGPQAAGLGLAPPGRSCALATGGYDTAEDGCITITRHTPTRKYLPLYGPRRPLFSPLAQTGSKPWRGDSIDKLGVKSSLHVYTRIHALSSKALWNFLLTLSSP